MNTEITDIEDGPIRVAVDAHPARTPVRGELSVRVTPLILLLLTVFMVRDRLAPWAFMWALGLALFMGCKWLSFHSALAGGLRPRLPRSVGYFFGWPGMSPAFLRDTPPVHKPGAGEWLGTAANIFFGAALIWGMARMFLPAHPLVAGWIGMVGLILVLHFGVLQLLSLAWRNAGVPATPLMRSPISSESLAEFWGRRWNTAFQYLAHEFLFRRLRRSFGAGGATLAVFFVSGLVHELMISVPARGGYGLPTAYFLLQGAGVLLERTDFATPWRVGKGMPGWLFTMAVTAGPVFWLFHPPFVLNVIVPFLKAINAC